MITQITRAGNPFPAHGTSRDKNGVIHFDDLPGSLPAMLHGWAERSPDAEAVVELDGDRLSYRQLWDRAARVAGGLRARGVTGGSRVALRYPAGVRWVLGFWGTLLAGGVAVAVNIRSAQPEVEFVLEDSGAVVDLGPDDPLPDGEPYVAPAPARDAVAAMFYTSGTTGRPKGVPTTHDAFLSNCENLVRVLGVTRDVGCSFRTLISVPLFHVTGCNTQLLGAAYVGGAAVMMSEMKRPSIFQYGSRARSFKIGSARPWQLPQMITSFAWIIFPTAHSGHSVMRHCWQRQPARAPRWMLQYVTLMGPRPAYRCTRRRRA